MDKGVLVVTGGSRGIGAATARLAAERGYAVVVNYAASADAAQAALGDAGLQSSIQTEATCDAPVDTVTGQSPQAGTEVEPGATVDITIAEEPPQGCGGQPQTSGTT